MGISRRWNNSTTFYFTERAIRYITKSHYLEHTSPLFKSLKTLTVFQIFESNCSLFAFKCINCNVFPYFRDKISHNLNIHSYNTRSNDNFRTNERAKLRIIQRSFLHKGITLWNSLENWKWESSLSTFKKKIKTYLIGNS